MDKLTERSLITPRERKRALVTLNPHRIDPTQFLLSFTTLLSFLINFRLSFSTLPNKALPTILSPVSSLLIPQIRPRETSKKDKKNKLAPPILAYPRAKPKEDQLLSSFYTDRISPLLSHLLTIEPTNLAKERL